MPIVRRRLLGLALAGAGTLVPAATAQAGGATLRPLTLHRLSRDCFSAPAAPGGWPVWPRSRPHPIRGGFNDPRGGVLAHFGVDVPTGEGGRAYAVASGELQSRGPVGSARHFRVGAYLYWHVRLAARYEAGDPIRRGVILGRVAPGERHVHLTEWRPGCGFVDPRRPTGVLADRANTEAPVIAGLAAFTADEAAFAPFEMGPGAPTADPATPVALDALSGVVDLRADVYDMPRRRTTRWPQQPLMVAGIRSYLAPARRPGRRIGRPQIAFVGDRLIRRDAYFDVMAFGTRRLRNCFSSATRPCLTRLVLHVAGGGFDTRSVRDGRYQVCVGAVTIGDRRARRCWPVAIDNAAGATAHAGMWVDRAAPAAPTDSPVTLAGAVAGD